MRTRIGFKVGSPGGDWATVESIWRRGGELDVFESAWTNDHLDMEGPMWEGWTTLASLAHLVPGRLVGHLVLANPFRHPAVLAKAAMVLDHATRGHFVLGIGVGSWPPEFDSYRIPLLPIPERLAHLEAALRLLRACFGRPATELAGAADDPGGGWATPTGEANPRLTIDTGVYALHEARFDPAPFRPGGPPIWLGTQGEKVGMRLVATYADGWNFGSEGGLEAFTRKREALLRACEQAGRDPRTVAVSVQLPIGEDLAAARRDAEAYCRLGLDHFVLFLNPGRGVPGLEAAAREIAFPLRDAFG